MEEVDGIVEQNTVTLTLEDLTEEERAKLEAQNSRIVSPFKAQQLEKHASRNWDLFYKRNETLFFKDRNWTTREFQELLDMNASHEPRKMLEVGCGVGNLIFPLDEVNKDLFIYACDFSPRAVEFVKKNTKYDESRMKVFQCDITEAEQFEGQVPEGSLDMITMIFVLSAIHPEKFAVVVRNLHRLLKAGGKVLFRDYGRNDMAQIRFKPGSKIAEHLYVRQDGTRSFFFSIEEVQQLFTDNGFAVESNVYVRRRTINAKEKLNVPRTFVQGKFIKVANKVGLPLYTLPFIPHASQFDSLQEHVICTSNL